MIGLICGSDGVVALSYQLFTSIAAQRCSAIHLPCYRDHGEHYEVSGPDGKLRKKIAPSSWNKLLDLAQRQTYEIYLQFLRRKLILSTVITE